MDPSGQRGSTHPADKVLDTVASHVVAAATAAWGSSTDMVPTDRPRLELVWPGKDEFLLVPSDDEGKPVWVDRNHPAASEVRLVSEGEFFGSREDNSTCSADNLLFSGDSIDVVRILAEHPDFSSRFRGRVKCVYIDPPFNTGQAFDHYDDWMEHSTWLSFMRDRLLLLKELLAPDGFIWVHLDDVEVHRMRCLLDEVFGAGNYRNTVVWKRTGAKSAATRTLSRVHDQILLYSKSDSATLVSSTVPYSEEYLRSKYASSDERGRYQLTSLMASGVRTGDSGKPWRGVDPTAKGRHWGAPQAEEILGPSARDMTTRQKLDALLEAGYIELPRDQAKGTPRFKFYLRADGGTVLPDLWSDVNVINSQASERRGFETQKPEQLISRIIKATTNPGDIVLDCFGGSGTTAAVAHKLGRQWVTAEIQNETVDRIIAPRLRDVVAGVDESGVSESRARSGTSGFRRLFVRESMYQVAYGMVLLQDWATNGDFARAVSAQLGFSYTDGHPFCAERGRMKLAVLDGAVGPEECEAMVGKLDETERLTIVAKLILPGAEEVLRSLSRGSRIRKAPRDLLLDSTSRNERRRRSTP